MVVGVGMCLNNYTAVSSSTTATSQRTTSITTYAETATGHHISHLEHTRALIDISLGTKLRLAL